MSYKYNKIENEPGIYSYLTKTGKTFYRVRIKHDDRGDDKEYSKQGFKTLAQAKKHKKDIEVKLGRDEVNAVYGAKRTLSDHWESYKEFKAASGRWNKGTLNTNTTRIEHFLTPLGRMPLKSITKNDVQHVINSLYETKPDYSQETILGFVKVFWQVIDDAVDEEFLEKNRFKKLSWEKPGGHKPKKKVLDLEDYEEFMKLAKKYLRADVYRCFYLATFGLRRSEVYGIRQSAIHFLDNGLAKIDINWARTRHYPKGKDVKSRDSNRFIIVDEKATDMLHKQISAARKIKVKNNQTLHFEDYIFIDPKTGKPYHIALLNEHLNTVAEKMDKKINVSPHMFRHMFATNASASGVDSLQLRKYLGHADLNMTNHYTHGSIEGAEKVMRLTEKYRK